jgi:monofunctional biosynthetic peptidoglycan transglycosylase
MDAASGDREPDAARGEADSAAAEIEVSHQPAAQPSAGWPARVRATAPGLLRTVARLAGLAVIYLVCGSLLLVVVLRWVDPPASSFMLQHALVAAHLGRSPPYYHHHWVPWDHIPPKVALAVVAAEDQRFPDHSGFDWVEIRKAWADYRRGEGLRGASTITQQTAKNLFLWPQRSWVRKGLEVWFTGLMELLWPKRRILEVYLNIAQFSASTYGVGAASERYFMRPLDELGVSEAALLAAVLPAPSANRLDRPSPRLRRRAEWIADQMGRLGGRRYLGGL